MPKPKDFTESAVKLCNPGQVKELLDLLTPLNERAKAIEEELGSNPLQVELEDIRSKIADTLSMIRANVDEHGSYQDVENERYGVKYARRTAVYGNLPSFKKNFPKFVELCIKEEIDVTALKGQIKGKLISEEDLEKFNVLKYETGYAFYVR